MTESRSRKTLAPRFTEGNVTHLTVPSSAPAERWFWTAQHAEWWYRTGQSLDWQPISLYQPYLDESMAIASPVLLRDATRWMYGSRVGDEWRRFSEGGSWTIEDFHPTHFANVDLDDSIILGQD